MNDPNHKDAIRKAIRTALPDIEPGPNDMPAVIRSTYVPPSHVKALDPDNPLVEGIRGSGKSFWTTALTSEEHRKFVVEAYPETRMRVNMKISLGFGTQPNRGQFPDKDTLRQLAEKHEPRQIWRSVLATQLEFPDPYPKNGKWGEKVAWVSENPEEFEEFLQLANDRLGSEDRIHIILFDALDRLADNWDAIRPLARALFQIALEIQAYRAIRLKLFVRPDMLEDPAILNFPDASKISARKVQLTWRKVDLYALVYQCLANDPENGWDFRELAKSIVKEKEWIQKSSSKVWILPDSLRMDENTQRSLFEAVAGKNMASGDSGYKRGKPYTWLPNHLIDGREQVSPRSFCIALHKAAEHESMAQANWSYALHFKGIHYGVQEASRNRVVEIREDYPWVDEVMSPLGGHISVPCPRDLITAIWQSENTIDLLRQHAQSGDAKLPPQHLESGANGLMEDLEGLGIIQRQSDGRIQMPDVYRIAFKIGRRGGVPPLK